MTIVRPVALAAFAAAFLSAQDSQKPAAVEAAAKAPQVQNQVPTVGVVNLDRAIDTYPRWVKLKADLEGMQKTFDDRLTQMSKSLKELKATIDAEAADSEGKRIKELQYGLMLQEQKGQADILRDQLELEFARAQVVVYEDLETAIQKVARQKGLGLVLRQYEPMPPAGDPTKLSPRSVQKRIAEFERRGVWYAAESVDITADVIKVLMVPLDTGKAADKPTEKPADKATPNAKSGGQ
ncbi:MAG: OmpH family outer membrane protein [Planctomycetes bacterium]|nr:OmpH family outer membrane protein [Planctomycetota bacterium]